MQRNVLITGSSKGIGAEIARVLANNGCNVFLSGRNEEALKNLAEKIGAKGFCVIDLLENGAAQKLFDEATKVLGKVDTLINNAGVYHYNPVENVTDEAISELLKLNTELPYKLISLCVKNMKAEKFGRIVNIGSISGAVGEANASLYSLTKSALIGMTKALALELAQENITVNTINPGFVQTELLENTFDKDFTKEELLDMIPQGRFIQPIEIANLVKYLISDEAKGFTGQAINLCAGMSI